VTTRGAKRLLMGLAILLFSLMLVFAGLAFAFIAFATNSPVGSSPGLIVWLAILVGVVGLAVAYVGFSGND
jgi:hypothetical protein